MAEDFEALNRVLDARYSCRGFKPDPVSEDVTRRIVGTAGKAASWCNAQPWRVVVTQGNETERFRSALLEAVASGKPGPDLAWPEDYPGVYGERRRTCGYQLYGAVGIDRKDYEARAAQAMRNFHLFDAPHVAIIHSEAKLGAYGAHDCGEFVLGFMLAATAQGVATVAQASVAGYANFIREHFGLDDSRMVLCAISFGYEDPDHPANQFRTERAGVDELLDLRG